MWTRGSEASSVGGRCLACPMSTTVREEYEVGDLDPGGVLEAAAEAERGRTTRRVPQAPARRPLGRPPPRHRRHRGRDVRWGGAPGRRVTRRRRHPGRGGVHPGTVRVGVGHVPVGRGPADRRRPRPAPPAPPAVETGVRLEVPAWQARRVARQTHRLPKAAAIWVDEQLADRGTCGPVVVDRLVAHAIAAYDPETHEDRENDAQAGWDVTLTHPEADRLPRHLPPRSHRRHPGPQGVLRPGLRHRPPAVPRRRHRPLGVRKVKALGIITGQPQRSASRRSRCTSASTPATSNPTPSPSVRSRSSAPPPSPRSATGSATTKSSSNPC